MANAPHSKESTATFTVSGKAYGKIISIFAPLSNQEDIRRTEKEPAEIASVRHTSLEALQKAR
jgi:hypothetical protein